MAFSVYSLSDVSVTINNDAVKKCVLSDCGAGRITISHAGDMASNTRTATGYVVVNRLVSRDGSIGLEIPNNSEADAYMRKWINHLKTCKTSEFAKTTLTVNDPAGGRTLTMSGVVPQKEPDEGYDQTAGNRQYNLLYAEMKESKSK